MSERNWMDDLKFGDVIEYSGASAKGNRSMIVAQAQGNVVECLHLSGPRLGSTLYVGPLGYSKKHQSLWRKVST